MEEKKHVHANIIGRVQGVFFRMETRKAAELNRVTGWVRNKSDGTVEAVFEGTPENVDSVIQWCRTGPPLSKVEKVVVTDGAYTGEFSGFDIRY